MVKTSRAEELRKKEQHYAVSYSKLIVGIGVVLLLVGIIATLMCRSHMQEYEYDLLLSHRNAQEAWVSATSESIRARYVKTLDKIRQISTAELLRLALKDYAGNYGEEKDQSNEELKYITDILADTARRSGWIQARLLDLDGKDFIAEAGAQKLDHKALSSLILAVKKARAPKFSCVYKIGDDFVIDFVDPLYEELGARTPAIVGFLFATVKITEHIQYFFSKERLPNTDYKPVLVSESPTDRCILVENESITISPYEHAFPEKIPFLKRLSFMETGDVRSCGYVFSAPPWLIAIEYSDAKFQEEISSAARRVYSIGVLGSLALALVLTIIAGTWYVRRKGKEEERCINGLVHAIECSLDGEDEVKYLQGRSEKVARMSLRLAKMLNFSAKMLEDMLLAARLSQVGKIFVPRDVMTKRGLLTEEERRLVQLAPYHAYNVLKGVLPRRVAHIIYQMGGKVIDDPVTGANHEIPVDKMREEARVLLVANDFCAMVSQRGKRPPLPISVARENLAKFPKYDPKVVEAINQISDEEIRQIFDLPAPSTEENRETGKS